MGFSLTETTALLGELANAGFDASTAGTATRGILLNLADANGKLAKELGRPVKSLKDLIPALKELQKRGVDVGEALELTDKRTVAAFFRFLEGAGNVNVLNEALKDNKGFVRDAAKQVESGLGGSLRKMNSAFEGLQIQLAGSVGSLDSWVDSLTNTLGGVTAFIERNQGLVKALSRVAVGTIGVGTAVTATGIVLAIYAQAIGGLIAVKKTYNVVAKLFIANTYAAKRSRFSSVTLTVRTGSTAGTARRKAASRRQSKSCS